MRKNVLITVGVVVGVVVIVWLLMMLARGGNYNLTVVDPSIGPEDAVILIEEFSDYECPGCKAAAPAIKEAAKEYPTQVRFVYRDFPLPTHTQSRPAAIAALCAAQQDKFFEIHDGIFASQSKWTADDSLEEVLDSLAQEHELSLEDWNACRSSSDAKGAIKDDLAEAARRKVTSTPTFFLNGQKIKTPASVRQWIEVIDEELEKQGLEPENRETEEDPEADPEEDPEAEPDAEAVDES